MKVEIVFEKQGQIDFPSLESVFWKVGLTEFPHLKEGLKLLLPGFIKYKKDGLSRVFDKQCAGFFKQNNPSWPRYEKWLHYQNETSPLPQEPEEDAFDSEPDFYEMGRLFSHRLMMSYHSDSHKKRLLENVVERPYWELHTVDDGRACPGCKNDPKIPLHWQSEYWRNKTVPCEWLFCRSRICALSEFDIIEIYGKGLLSTLKKLYSA